jgi:hypothetical protein
LIELERTFILPLAPRWVRHSYLSKRLHTIPYTCGISVSAYHLATKGLRSYMWSHTRRTSANRQSTSPCRQCEVLDPTPATLMCTLWSDWTLGSVIVAVLLWDELQVSFNCLISSLIPFMETVLVISHLWVAFLLWLVHSWNPLIVHHVQIVFLPR